MSDDPDLQALLDGVMAAVDEDIAADPGCPDFAAVVARAHELDPQRIPAEVAAEVAQWAPVVSIQQAHRRRRTRDDDALLAVIEGVRADVEQDVAQRLGPPPPVQMEAPQTKGRWVWALTFAAAAAVLAVGFGVVQVGGGLLQSNDPSRSEAALIGPTRDEADTKTARVKSEEPAPTPEVAEERPEPELEPELESEPEAESAPTDATTTTADARPRRSRPRAPRPAPPSLEELDAMAQAAWKAGDLVEAERLFRTITTRAGRGRLGDLAYGDLFTLARQRGEPRTEVALWREYLRTFPQGRFADDASAGLCRRAAPADQRACWERYLETWPKGAHRGQAQRAVESAEGEP